jgi:hypothetical protein
MIFISGVGLSETETEKRLGQDYEKSTLRLGILEVQEYFGVLWSLSPLRKS